jgi:pimeloyl-ACP methyl ester carboxylesterase
MLHGWKDTLHTFDAIVPALAQKYRVLRLDLPGFGGTEMPSADWDVSEYVEFVLKFQKKINVDVFALMGHSFGGRISIRGAGSGRLTPKKLILISAAGVAKKRTLRNNILAVVAQVGRTLTAIPPFSFWRQKIRRKLYEAIGSDYFISGALKKTFVKVVGEDLTAFAGRITIPTLIIWGRYDTSTPIDQAGRIHALINGSELRVLEEAGHFVHQSESEKVADYIESFL